MSAPCFLTISRDEFDKQDHEGSTTVEAQLLPEILQAIVRRMTTAATDTPIEHIRSELWRPVADAAARGSVLVENNIQSLFNKAVVPQSGLVDFVTLLSIFISPPWRDLLPAAEREGIGEAYTQAHSIHVKNLQLLEVAQEPAAAALVAELQNHAGPAEWLPASFTGQPPRPRGHLFVTQEPFREGLLIPDPEPSQAEKDELAQLLKDRQISAQQSTQQSKTPLADWIVQGSPQCDRQPASWVEWLRKRAAHHMKADQLHHAQRYLFRACIALEQLGARAPYRETDGVLVDLERLWCCSHNENAAKLARQTIRALEIGQLQPSDAASLVIKIPDQAAQLRTVSKQYVPVAKLDGHIALHWSNTEPLEWQAQDVPEWSSAKKPWLARVRRELTEPHTRRVRRGTSSPLTIADLNDRVSRRRRNDQPSEVRKKRHNYV